MRHFCLTVLLCYRSAVLKPSWPRIRRLTTPPTTPRWLLRALITLLLHQHVDDRNDGARAAPFARCMQHVPVEHIHVVETDGMARHEHESHRHVATAMRHAYRQHADCTAIAFVSLSAQVPGSFDLPELTRGGGRDARERASRLGSKPRV